MYRYYNPNPDKKNVGDCTVRAICGATGKTWDEIHTCLCVLSNEMRDMPDSNRVWGEYLSRIGWRRKFLRDDCPTCYTVGDFCREYPRGTYILGLEGHVVCVRDGMLLDTWDSRGKAPLYYWLKEN